MVEGELGCDDMGETQSGSTVSMELTHVRKTFVGTWEGSALSRRVVRRDRIGEGGNRSRPHSILGWLAPAAYAARCEAQQHAGLS